MSSIVTTNKDDHVPLPGFRFHPTDEELVGFYLRRKVEKRPISIELIKQADIYKYDPWDLPKCSNGGEKERYFYCKRGRKYKNSIRPNRVTASGFWKATGIDRPIYSSRGDGRQCIGLKKSLVYYRGSAGKGTKTEWMMHEFRLPPTHDKHMDATQEAEVWTLCRILKRNVGSRKCVPEMANKRNKISNPAFYASSSVESCDQNSYICFSNAPQNGHDQNNLYSEHNQSIGRNEDEFPGDEVLLSYNDLLRHADWEDLRSVVDYAAATTNPLYM